MITKKEFYKLIKKIPKSEIHLHAEGVINKKTVQKLLIRKNTEYKNKEKINKIFNYNNLNEFIDSFLLIQNSFEKLSDFKELFYNLRYYLKINNIIYTEVFFSPSLFIQNGWQFKDMIDIFLKNIKKVKKKDNIIIKIIVDVSRSFGKENAFKNLKSVLEYKNKNIIGIGLGGYEAKGPAKDFTEIFEIAKKNKFHRVAHAGEDVDSQSIWDAINLLNAERIGHGTSAIYDEKLMTYLKEKRIPLEVCVTSNVFTKKYVKNYEEHPIRKFYEKGLLVTVNTDDPTFFNVGLIDEYWNLYKKLKFSLSNIKQLIINGFEASFIPKKKKKYFIKKVNSYWKKYIKKRGKIE